MPLQARGPGRIYPTDNTVRSFVIEWQEPGDGGCPITGYSIEINDGNGLTNFHEVNLDNDPAVRDKPSLRTFEITTFPASSEGKQFFV